jgi:hypothetical protein
MSEGPDVGGIIIGIFVILFGLGITLTGGFCSVLLIGSITQRDFGGMGGLLLVSLAVLALGLWLCWVGFKLLTGGYRR